MHASTLYHGTYWKNLEKLKAQSSEILPSGPNSVLLRASIIVSPQLLLPFADGIYYKGDCIHPLLK